MGYDIHIQVAEVISAADWTTAQGIGAAMLDCVYLVDRHALSLYLMDTVQHDDPVDVDFSVATFWHAENWTQALLGTFASCMSLDLVFTKEGSAKRVIHSIGREGPRKVFRAAAPRIIVAIRKLGREKTDNCSSLWATAAREEAHKLLSLMEVCEKTDRDPTFRHKAGRAQLVAARERDIVRRQYFSEKPKRRKADRWTWSTEIRRPIELPVDFSLRTPYIGGNK